MKKLKLIMVLAAGALMLGACCCKESKLVGTWLQPIPGFEEGLQGMTLSEGGGASSVNMSTLVYEKWSVDGKKLTLSGQSIGNGQTIQFSETYTIEKLDGDQLILKGNDGVTLSLIRKK